MCSCTTNSDKDVKETALFPLWSISMNGKFWKFNVSRNVKIPLAQNDYGEVWKCEYP